MVKDENVDIIIPQGNKHVKKTSFQGSAYFNVIAMYYLSHKYDDCCVIFNETYQTEPKFKIHWNKKEHNHEHNESCVLLPKSLNHIPSEQTDVSLRWIETNKKGYISVPKPEKDFWKKFTKCSQRRFVILPFGFTCKTSGHANWLLYDKKTKSLERFETFGEVDDDPSCLNPKGLDNKIRKLFEDNLGKDYIKNYYKPSDYLPNRGFQAIQEDENEMHRDDPVGFCSLWSAWYIDLRVSNPNVDRKQLVKIAMKKLKTMPISFTQFIRNYAEFIVQVSQEIEKLY